MAIIWGYRRGAARDLGPALAIRCSTCAELEFWHLHRSVTWFTIFFIPLLPPEFLGSESQFRRLHPDWPLALYWVTAYGALVGFALGAVLGFWLAGVPRRRARARLSALRTAPSP